MSDEELTLDVTVTEIDMLVHEHGIMGGSYRFLRAHTTARAWVRLGLFLAAYALVWSGYNGWTLEGPYGMRVVEVGPWEAAIWAAATLAIMAIVWTVLDRV